MWGLLSRASSPFISALRGHRRMPCGRTPKRGDKPCFRVSELFVAKWEVFSKYFKMLQHSLQAYQGLTIRGKKCDRCPSSYLAEWICGLMLVFDVASSRPFIKSVPWADPKHYGPCSSALFFFYMGKWPGPQKVFADEPGASGGQELPCPCLHRHWQMGQYPDWESH
jgi:hypothetical protein